MDSKHVVLPVCLDTTGSKKPVKPLERMLMAMAVKMMFARYLSEKTQRMTDKIRALLNPPITPQASEWVMALTTAPEKADMSMIPSNATLGVPATPATKAPMAANRMGVLTRMMDA